uniref:TPR_REGION domain-containing protein n=1 Tax=Schistosoma mansoni TaxID=6183 RepID=A0A3Q0KQ57_SCHMA
MAENNETYCPHNDCVSEIKKIFSDIPLSELDDDTLVNNLLERSVSVLQVIDYAMSYFVAVNFIDGSVDESYEFDGCFQLALEDLCCEGEYPFRLTKSLSLFWLCKRLCRKMSMVSQTLSFLYHLNYLKCIYLHQYLIGDERSPKLKSEFQDIINVCEECLDSTHTTEDVIQYLMLSSYLSAFYYEYEASKTFATRCSQYLNIDVKFCGALGKCTRFQEKEVATLTVKVNRVVESKDNKTSGNCPLPQIISLGDDVLLNNVIFSTIEEQIILSNTEQSFILLLCELHRRHYPRDDITEQQCLAYINTVIRAIYPDSENEIKSSSSWPIATETLFRRSLLEHNSVRRTERALSQLEELSCQFKRTSPSFSERSPSTFFLSRMPSIWTLQVEQGRLLMKIGCYKSALDIFLLWDKWSEIIECYIHLNKREKAEEVIRSRLNSGDESAELYCSLGDVTNDRQHYLKAWDVSGCKSARAIRSLAVTYMYTDKDYQKAIECFEKSLEINTLQVNVWFTFGCCCLQAKEFVKAENAFRSCVRLDPDNFEAWNNCATAVLIQGKKNIALKLMKEACKYSYENWRIWENILLISADVKAFHETIYAYHRLLDLQGKYANPQVLSVMVKGVILNEMDSTGNPASNLRAKLLELFGRVTASTPNDAVIWNEYAHLLVDELPQTTYTTYQRAVHCLQAAHRCRIQSSEGPWEQSTKKCETIIDGLKALLDLLNNPPKLKNDDNESNEEDQLNTFIQSALATLRISIKSVISKMKIAEESILSTDVQDMIHSSVKDLNELLIDVERKLN